MDRLDFRFARRFRATRERRIATGRRKFYVWLMLFVVYSALRTLPEIRALTFGVGGRARRSRRCGDSGQFVHMYRATPRFFYFVYVNGNRITGFVDHWMTFSVRCS